jgi:hypothetical protein
MNRALLGILLVASLLGCGESSKNAVTGEQAIETIQSYLLAEYLRTGVEKCPLHEEGREAEDKYDEYCWRLLNSESYKEGDDIVYQVAIGLQRLDSVRQGTGKLLIQKYKIEDQSPVLMNQSKTIFDSDRMGWGNTPIVSLAGIMRGSSAPIWEAFWESAGEGGWKILVAEVDGQFHQLFETMSSNNTCSMNGLDQSSNCYEWSADLKLSGFSKDTDFPDLNLQLTFIAHRLGKAITTNKNFDFVFSPEKIAYISPNNNGPDLFAAAIDYLSSASDKPDVVRQFYEALGLGDGEEAAKYITPSKRGKGSYDPKDMTAFYSSLRERLKLAEAEGVMSFNPYEYEVRYTYTSATGSLCEGHAIVKTVVIDDVEYIQSINANC